MVSAFNQVSTPGSVRASAVSAEMLPERQLFCRFSRRTTPHHRGQTTVRQPYSIWTRCGKLATAERFADCNDRIESDTPQVAPD